MNESIEECNFYGIGNKVLVQKATIDANLIGQILPIVRKQIHPSWGDIIYLEGSKSAWTIPSKHGEILPIMETEFKYDLGDIVRPVRDFPTQNIFKNRNYLITGREFNENDLNHKVMYLVSGETVKFNQVNIELVTKCSSIYGSPSIAGIKTLELIYKILITKEKSEKKEYAKQLKDSFYNGERFLKNYKANKL